MSRQVKLFLTVSLLLNLLLIGVILGNIGHYLAGHGHHGMGEIAAALPPERRELFESTMEHTKEITATLRQQLTEARGKAGTLLKTEPFDKAVYIAQMNAIHELRGQIMQQTVQDIAQLAQQFSQPERATLADLLRHPMHDE